MDNLNNLYNFKNPIRHFFNLDKMKFENLENLKFKDLGWTEPIKFNIFKTENSQRTLSFPNILNFYILLEKLKTLPNFKNIPNMSYKKRVTPDLELGEFAILSYDKAMQRDFFNLTKYDKLLMLDIKSFYGRIYTHDLDVINNMGDNMDSRLASLNRGRTNGLLLGSYVSLFLAETFLLDIEKELDEELKKEDINCQYEYFSDDFYFFCNNKDIEVIKKIFIKVLNAHDMELNDSKTAILDFEEYSKNNNLEKLWKKIIKVSIEKDEENRKSKKTNKNHPAFFTQLVYRLSQINEFKYKRVFLTNFFRTSYFNDIIPSQYTLSDNDFNYICYIYKVAPESIIYSLTKILKMDGFNKRKFKEFVKERFNSSLCMGLHDEQIYFYYAIHQLQFVEILTEFKQKILDSKNQILISYLLVDKKITKEEYQKFLIAPKEANWLQNYHYVLTYDNSNIDILIPSNIKAAQKSSYINFYKSNIDAGITIVKPIKKAQERITSYVQEKLDKYVENEE